MIGIFATCDLERPDREWVPSLSGRQAVMSHTEIDRIEVAYFPQALPDEAYVAWYGTEEFTAGCGASDSFSEAIKKAVEHHGVMLAHRAKERDIEHD